MSAHPLRPKTPNLMRGHLEKTGRRNRLPLTLLVPALALLAALILLAGPTAAETDGDGDGFSDLIENFVNTDPSSACNSTTASNDEDVDAWPPDFNDDTRVDIADVAEFRDVYGSAEGDTAYSTRFDLNGDGQIDVSDVARLRSFYDTACEPPVPPPPAGTFLETFDGQPATPLEGSFYSDPRWDVSLTPNRGDPLSAEPYEYVQMGPNCEPPPTTHFNDTYRGVVFICRGHLMTGFTNGGYDALYLTPAVLVDLSQGEAAIRWEQSTLITSTRDWTNFWIVPVEDNVSNPTENQFADGLPRRGVGWIRGEIFVIRDWAVQEKLGSCCRNIKGALATAGLTPDPKRRDLFEIRLTPTSMTVSMPEYDYVLDAGTFSQPLNWTKAIFQMAHVGYNPTKGNVPSGHDCTPSGVVCPNGNTWHWDNVSITPAIPFDIVRGPRVLDNASNEWTFPPAPPNSFLRFSSRRNGYAAEVSFNGGATWESVQLNEGDNDNDTAPVFHPVPEGATGVLVRNQQTGNWMALDVNLWSLPDGSGS